MSVNELEQLIGSFGFPIVAFFGIAYFYVKQFTEFKDVVTKNNILTQMLIDVLAKNGKDVE